MHSGVKRKKGGGVYVRVLWAEWLGLQCYNGGSDNDSMAEKFRVEIYNGFSTIHTISPSIGIQ